MSDPGRLPTGTVTFLFTDIEGSTRLVQRLDAGAFGAILEAHHRILRTAFAAHGGVERGTQGDSFLVVFRDAPSALAAAVDAQRAVAAEMWPEGISIRVRMGLHSGEGIAGGDDYVGVDINRAARIAGVAHGGQILISEATRVLGERALPAGVRIRDLGRHRLKDLTELEHLFQLEVEGLPDAFPAIRGADRPPGNLPDRLTSFVGREAELGWLADLLQTGRLVTLTGTGGTGKTSLAVELARQVAERFPDGAWLVELAAVNDPDVLLPTIARTLGLSDGIEGPAVARLAPHLAERTTLLVLDNLEQLLDAAPDISRLLLAAPALKVVATSRAPLRIAGEQEAPIPPLRVAAGTPASEARADTGDEASAVRLFVERARAVRPTFELDAVSGPVIAEICALLDGLPLGIELAAARTAVLPLTAIRDRLAARLPLPGQAPRDLPTRQRTLEDAIAWSVALLDDPSRRIFQRIGVFSGGFDLEEVESVCGPSSEVGADVVSTVITLVEQSLLVAAPSDGGGVRYRPLETTRAVAAAGLRDSGEEPAIQERHARTYLALAERAAPALPGSDQVRWLDRLAADDANLRIALLWAIAHPEPDVALRLATALWRYWTLDGRIHEGRALTEAAFATPGAAAPTAVRLRALDALGGVAYWQGDAEASSAAYVEQLDLARTLGVEAEIANAAFNLAHSRFASGDQGPATEMLDLAEAGFRRAGDARMLNRLAWSRSTTLARTGRPVEARAAFEAALEAFRRDDDTWYQGLAYGSLSWMDIQLGDPRSGLRWGLAALRIAQRMRDRSDVTLALLSITFVLRQLGRPREAAVLYGTFEELSRLHGLRPPAGLAMLMGQEGLPSITLPVDLGEAAYVEALAEGARLTGDDAIAIVQRIADELDLEPVPV